MASYLPLIANLVGALILLGVTVALVVIAFVVHVLVGVVALLLLAGLAGWQLATYSPEVTG